jgi:uncharacterized protein (DUF2336 family)
MMATMTKPATTENLLGGEAARVRRAARDTDPTTLEALTHDPQPTVRAAVALNPTFAPGADAQLVNDTDERVRSLLATKMARLLPSLSGREQEAAQAHVHTMLRCLASDAAVRVRAAIAEALTSVGDAPRDVILKLAQDPAIVVSDPIVRFSPLLTDADLLGLLATPPNDKTAVAVATRVGLGAEVADTIARHADTAAVVALLSNRSATIQEATLDSLIGRAGAHPEWHEPLVARPSLPGRSIRALSLIVARHLLDALLNRADIPDDIAAELRGQIAQSLTEPQPPSEADILDSVRQLNATGQLNEAALIEAATTGDARQAGAILAVAAGVTLPLIDRAVALRSAKALISLVHRAGFSMQAGTIVQSVLGRLSPGERMPPGPDGAFPLSADEMVWQIELLSQPGR